MCKILPNNTIVSCQECCYYYELKETQHMFMVCLEMLLLLNISSKHNFRKFQINSVILGETLFKNWNFKFFTPYNTFLNYLIWNPSNVGILEH